MKNRRRMRGPRARPTGPDHRPVHRDASPNDRDGRAGDLNVLAVESERRSRPPDSRPG